MGRPEDAERLIEPRFGARARALAGPRTRTPSTSSRPWARYIWCAVTLDAPPRSSKPRSTRAAKPPERTNPVYVDLLGAYGMALAQTDRRAEAEPLLEEALAKAPGARDDQPNRALELQRALAWIYKETGRGEEAVRLLRDVAATQRSLHDAPHPAVSGALSTLAVALRESGGDLDEALALDREVVAMNREIYASPAPDLASAIHNLGLTHLARRELDEATSRIGESLAMMRETYGHDFPLLYTSLGTLARIEMGRGAHDAAIPHLREALASLERWPPRFGRPCFVPLHASPIA